MNAKNILNADQINHSNNMLIQVANQMEFQSSNGAIIIQPRTNLILRATSGSILMQQNTFFYNVDIYVNGIRGTYNNNINVYNNINMPTNVLYAGAVSSDAIYANALTLQSNNITNVKQTSTITDAATNLVIPNTLIFSNVTTSNISLTPTLNIAYTITPFTFRYNIFNKLLVNLNFRGQTSNVANTGGIYIYADIYNSSNNTTYYGNTFKDTTPYVFVQSGLQPRWLNFSYSDIYDITPTPIANLTSVSMRVYMGTDNNSFATNRFINGTISMTVQPVIS